MLKVRWGKKAVGLKGIKSYVKGQGMEMLRYLSENGELGYFRSMRYCTDEGWPAKLADNIEENSTDMGPEEKEWFDNLKDLRDSLKGFDFRLYDSMGEKEKKDYVRVSVGQFGQKLQRLLPGESVPVDMFVKLVDMRRTTTYVDGVPIEMPEGLAED